MVRSLGQRDERRAFFDDVRGSLCRCSPRLRATTDLPSKLAQRPERCPELGCEELGLLPSREMPALVDLMIVGEVAIRTSCPGLGRSIDIVRKYGDGHRQRDLRGLLRTRGNYTASSAVLPIQAPGRGRRVRQPVERDVVEDI